MSHVKLLHQNDFGYTYCCPGSEDIRVCFGNLGLVTNKAEFQSFRQYISHAYHYYRHPQHLPTDRSIALRTPVDNMMLLFNLTELTQLQEMLEHSALLLEIEQLLSKKDAN